MDAIQDGVKAKITLWPNGNVKLVVPYNDAGKIHGGAHGYTKDGKLDNMMTYVDGVLHGYSIRYKKDGTIKLITLFENGEIVPMSEWIHELD
jgi:antitoxin component YwqK of YwqJK toxin-antitoxin module